MSEITGQITAMTPAAPRGASGYMVGTILVTECTDKYPEKALIEFGGDKRAPLLDGFHVGDIVTVAFSMDAREHNGRTFGSNRGWKITRERQESKPRDRDEVPPPVTAAPTNGVAQSEPDNELPF